MKRFSLIIFVLVGLWAPQAASAESRAYAEGCCGVSKARSHPLERVRHRQNLDLRRFSGELFVHSRSAISNWTGLR